jgi:uncharacterized protein YndB with AHSA1/START domain
MIITVVLIALVCFAGLVAIIALQPADFMITRTAAIPAPAAVVFDHINDFHKWEAWSPWAELDPKAKNTYSGAPSGEGAIFTWAGNSKVGAGKMTLLESRPNQLIRIKLEFLKPFKAVHRTEFTFSPGGEITTVTWTMTGKNNFMAKAFTMVMNCDKMVGGQFEKGLNNLKNATAGKRTVAA